MKGHFLACILLSHRGSRVRDPISWKKHGFCEGRLCCMLLKGRLFYDFSALQTQLQRSLSARKYGKRNTG